LVCCFLFCILTITHKPIFNKSNPTWFADNTSVIVTYPTLQNS
jgi:hypothetical protein